MRSACCPPAFIPEKKCTDPTRLPKAKAASKHDPLSARYTTCTPGFDSRKDESAHRERDIGF
jgi:hypothetical protein